MAPLRDMVVEVAEELEIYGIHMRVMVGVMGLKVEVQVNGQIGDAYLRCLVCQVLMVRLLPEVQGERGLPEEVLEVTEEVVVRQVRMESDKTLARAVPQEKRLAEVVEIQ